MPIGSIAGGLIGQAGAQQGGQMAYNAAMGGATTAQNILNDQRKDNRVAQSPYLAAGRGALSDIGMLLGWGNLFTEGGHDDWKFSGPFDQAKADAQQQAQRKKLLEMANISGPLPTAPTFTRLNVPTSFEADPGYAFRQKEGQKALERGAAARGKLLSGEQYKALEDFNSGLASQEYGNWWNRYTGGTQFNNAATQQEFGNALGLNNTQYGRTRDVMGDWMQLAGLGQGATNSLTGVNSSLAGNIGNAFTSAGISGGQALGQGYAQGANALASGIGSATQNAMDLAFNWNRLLGGGGKSGYTGSGWTY